MSPVITTGLSGGSPNRLEINDFVKDEKFFSLYIQALRQSRGSVANNFWSEFYPSQRPCITKTKASPSPSSKSVGSMAFLISHGMVLQVTRKTQKTRSSGEDTVCINLSFSQPGTEPTWYSSRFVLHPSSIYIPVIDDNHFLANFASACPKDCCYIHCRPRGLEESRY